MEGSYNPEAAHRPLSTLGMRGPRGYKLFKNPPQPHMCIQDSIKGTSEKLYINVMSWKQIGSTKQSADLIPLYGGMQIPHGCTPNCNKPPLTVFAVMVNPEILKVNGKCAPNPEERDALVGLLCDFVEAMNPGLQLTRQPVILKDRDLAGELKDVWHAVQIQREREKLRSQEANNEVTHKIYHIDGPPENDSRMLNESNIPRVSTESDNNQKNQNSSNNSKYINNKNGVHPEPNAIDIKEYYAKVSNSSNQNENDLQKLDESKQNANKKLANVKPFIKKKTLCKPKESLDDYDHVSQKNNENINICSKSDDDEMSNKNTKPPMMLIDDNKDIPFVDEYHDNDHSDSICKNENSLGNMMQNLQVNLTKTNKSDCPSVRNYSDQNKVSLSSHQS